MPEPKVHAKHFMTTPLKATNATIQRIRTHVFSPDLLYETEMFTNNYVNPKTLFSKLRLVEWKRKATTNTPVAIRDRQVSVAINMIQSCFNKIGNKMVRGVSSLSNHFIGR